MEKSFNTTESLVEDPITLEVMEEAVIASCGHSFSKQSITDWLQKNPKCPLCNTLIKAEELKPNYKLRELIEGIKSLTSSGITATPNLSLSTTQETKSQIIVKELHPSFVIQASVALRKSFMSDPWIAYFFNNKPVESSLDWFCSIIVSYGTKHGRVWAHHSEIDKNHVIGCAVWQPPYESGVSLWSMFKEGIGAAPFKLGLRPTYRLMGALNETERIHNEIMKKKPHWSIYTIGVEPLYQCKGIGTKLLEPILKLADEDKVPCYLDTASERSLNFFIRLGFKVLRTVNSNGKFPKFWAMVRQPGLLNAVVKE
eukprot:TRINITY_DN5659_c0_g1_i1.p1 TRINITY_DN5659_c0_g1~~TRINITY_DN5659_c0_g1_i1.p1  ORF type:complete len:313 (+),score=46.95 TRINITY_DN5659_c0_g1_i1:58-996(+)